MQNRVRLVRACLFVAAFLSFSFAVFAQNSSAPPRITVAVNESQLTTLRGNTHPYARAEYDRGAAPDSLPMARMLLVLKRSPAQEAALDALLDQQQDSSSPNYHAWLTPQQFGQEFGAADADIQTITQWLESHGFSVNRVSNGRTVIEFSGTAGQVRDTFHTEIHRYNVNNENHWANASDPQIPTALAPVVAGIDTLYNFPRHAMHHVAGRVSRSKTTGKIEPAAPLFTLGGSCGVPGLGCYGVTPYDFATIYNVLPLWNATPATDGTGETIAIVAETDIAATDISSFRSYFGLPANAPTVILDGTDPGTVQGDETESDLDVEWAGAVAKGATIDFVESATTDASLGVDLSAQYVVDNNLAPILSESYGICELFLGSAGNQFYNQLWQQASAQGITALVATGDSGSAVCDRNAGNSGAAQLGLSVSGFSSTPYNVAVGGTDFFDLTNAASYWSGSNSVPPGAPAGTPATLSALSYIPETTWNDSCTNAVFGNLLGYSNNAETNCNTAQLIANGFVNAIGGSGGKSNCTTYDGSSPASCTGGYAKPVWQSGSDGKRDVPDVSLFAASGSPSGAFYLICEADAVDSGASSCLSTDPSTEFLGVGGTSASTPSFAGIMALVDEKTGSRQGNANYILYKLAAQSGASCNSSNGAGTNCVFYDVTNGTIAMPCATGSPNCNTANPGDQFGVLSGYSTGTGYDLATGLGSVNANNLVKAWTTANAALKSSSTSLTLNSGSAVNITHGQSVPVSITVTGTPGTPTGNVSLIANTGTDGTEGVQGFTLSSGAASGTTNALPGGSYTVLAEYAGDASFHGSSSSTTSVTVAPEASKASLAYELLDPSTGAVTNPNSTSTPFGTAALLRLNVTSQAGDACPNNSPGESGCPTGNINVTDSHNGGASAPVGPGTFALNSQGYAEYPAIDLPGGTHAITMTYAGDASYKALSPAATTTLTITPLTTSATMSFFGPTGSPQFIFGQPETLNANISVAQLVYSNIVPTGTVTYYSGSTVVGTATVLGSIDPTTHVAQAQSTLTITTLAHGQDSLTAHYSGDASYDAVTSGAQLVTVLYSTSLVVTPSSASVAHGASVTLTATVTTSQTGSPPPITGTVVFSAGGATLGSAPLAGGQAQLTTSSLSPGLDVITATYSGDTNYATSNGNGDVTITLLPTSTALTTSNASVMQGASVTLTATVTATGNPPSPPALSGTVQFTYCFTDICGVAIGSPVTVTNGVAQVTTSSLQANTNTVTASYSGDFNYAASGATIPEAVSPPPDFQLSSTYNTVNVGGPGNSGTMNLNVASVGGFSGTINFTSCAGLPPESTCTFSPSSVTVSSGTPNAGTIVTVYTTAPSAIVSIRRDIPRGVSWRLALLWVALELLLILRFVRRRRPALALLLVAIVIACVSCGGGGSGGGGGGGGGSNSGTPVGVYPNAVVTATSGTVTHTFTFGVDVESH